MKFIMKKILMFVAIMLVYFNTGVTVLTFDDVTTGGRGISYPTWFNIDFLGIEALNTHFFGGTDNPHFGGGTYVAMDNNNTMDDFTFNNTTIPEPTVLLLLSIDLIGLGASRCKA